MKLPNWITNLARTMRSRVGANLAGWGFNTLAGPPISEESALKYSAVWCCVRIISETMASLPWCVYKKTSRGRTEDVKSSVYWILHNQPNPEMTSFIFKELMVRRALLYGNSFAEIERDAVGRPVWLWPLETERVAPRRNEEGQIVYVVKDVNGAEVILAAQDVFHLRGPGGDGIVGYSMIHYAAESIGAGVAMDKFGSSFFGNGAHVSVVLKHPKTLSESAREHLKQSLKDKYNGKSALSPMVIEEGMSIERMGVPPEDAQFLESRKFQIGDIARWYRLPPHKLGLLDRATWNNIEQQSIEFVTDAIVPWCVRLEQEADAKLYGRNNRGVYYTKFNVSAILRGDMKSRYDAYAVGRQWGWLSANDVLAFEDSNPIAGGNLYLVPSNMTTPERIKNGTKPEARQTESVESDPEPDDGDPVHHKPLNGAHRGKLNA